MYINNLLQAFHFRKRTNNILNSSRIFEVFVYYMILKINNYLEFILYLNKPVWLDFYQYYIFSIIRVVKIYTDPSIIMLIYSSSHLYMLFFHNISSHINLLISKHTFTFVSLWMKTYIEINQHFLNKLSLHRQ